MIFFSGGGGGGRGEREAGGTYVSDSQNYYACADGMFEQEKKTRHLQTPALERRTKRVIPGFQPVLPTLPPGTALRERYVGP